MIKINVQTTITNIHKLLNFKKMNSQLYHGTRNSLLQT